MISQTKKQRNFKCTDEDFDKILNNANRYAQGNVSAWIRYASMNYKLEIFKRRPSNKSVKANKKYNK